MTFQFRGIEDTDGNVDIPGNEIFRNVVGMYSLEDRPRMHNLSEEHGDIHCYATGRAALSERIRRMILQYANSEHFILGRG